MFATLMGAAHRDAAAKTLVKSLVPGERLLLERDVANEYDENAVRVFWHGTWIGFLERSVAAEVAPRMDAGEIFVCSVHMLAEGGGSAQLKPLLTIDASE